MIYICYGAKKSGSTLAYNLSRALVEECGHEHIALSAEARQDVLGHAGRVNTIRNWNPDVVAAIDAAVPLDQIVTFRTHHGPGRGRKPFPIEPIIAAGRAKVQISIRDPRDLALSMRDVVQRLKDLGRQRRGSQLDTTEELLAHLGRNLSYTMDWADTPGALILKYEDTAFTPERSMRSILQQLNQSLPPQRCLEIFDRVTSTDNAVRNKNVGRPARHTREMSAEDQEIILGKFPEFYRRFFPGAEVAVVPADPTKEPTPERPMDQPDTAAMAHKAG